MREYEKSVSRRGRSRAHVLSGGKGRFHADERGNVVVLFGLSLTALLGAVGLAIDVGQWELAHKNLQRAADAAAMSAAVAFQANGQNLANSSGIVQNTADVIAAGYGFVPGVAGTTITVNRPPSSGSYTTKPGAVEVIISQPQERLFSRLYGSGKIAETGRAVGIAGTKVCILALNNTAANAVNAQGAVNIVANGCTIYSDSNSSTAISAAGSASLTALSYWAVGGISGQSSMVATASNGFNPSSIPVADPYQGVSVPSFSGCDQTNFTAQTTETISPGVYCNGLTLNSSANVTLSPGVYYIDQGTFSVAGNATLTGKGVTIIFTSSNKTNPNSFATAKIAGGAVVDLTAPTTGWSAGLVLFGDPNMPVGTKFALAGGASQVFNGAVDISKGALSFAGGGSASNGCSEVIADTISFSGSSGLAIDCTGTGVRTIGPAAQLLE